MSLCEHIYFAVEPGSPVMKVFEDMQEAWRTYKAAGRAFAAKYGAEDFMTSGGRKLIGLVFPGEPPTPWKNRDGFAVPFGNSREARAVREELTGLPVAWSGPTIATQLEGQVGDGPYVHWGDGFAAWASLGEYAGTVVLSLPLPISRVPPGCSEIKMSELRELQEKQTRLDHKDKEAA